MGNPFADLAGLAVIVALLGCAVVAGVYDGKNKSRYGLAYAAIGPVLVIALLNAVGSFFGKNTGTEVVYFLIGWPLFLATWLLGKVTGWVWQRWR